VPTDTTTDEETAAMHTTTGVRAWLTVYLKGLAMGAADSVPGVSGGTIALITGIYERLIDALTELDPRILEQLPELDSQAGRRRFFDDLRGMDVFFLVVLGLGVVTSIVTISRVVHVALQMARPQTFAFFFGLIAASAVVLYDQLSLETPLEIGSAVAGFVIAFLVTGVSNGAGLGHALPLIFVAGTVAISAMVLPGISGAFLLILFGQYEYLTGVLTDLVDGLIAFGADDLLSNLTVVGTFGVGAVIGLFTVAHVVRRALDQYREATIAFLVSLMVGSLRLPLVEVIDGVDPTVLPDVTTALGAALVGGLAVLVLDYYTEDLSSVAT
jgi:putative membrane protein